MTGSSEKLLPDFKTFSLPLIGLPVSHVWQGHGSAIFLEFGNLHQGRQRRDGSPGNPIGDWSLAIEWSWRIEGKRRIWCGSFSDREQWPKALQCLKGSTVVSVSLYGRLPEISLDLSNGLHLLSMMTAEGDPEWSLTKRIGGISTSIYTVAGRLLIDARPST